MAPRLPLTRTFQGVTTLQIEPQLEGSSGAGVSEANRVSVLATKINSSTWNLSGDLLPTAGVAAPGPYTDDTAAAAGGVAVGGIYRVTGGTVAWRVS